MTKNSGSIRHREVPVACRARAMRESKAISGGEVSVGPGDWILWPLSGAGRGTAPWFPYTYFFGPRGGGGAGCKCGGGGGGGGGGSGGGGGGGWGGGAVGGVAVIVCRPAGKIAELLGSDRRRRFARGRKTRALMLTPASAVPGAVLEHSEV